MQGQWMGLLDGPQPGSVIMDLDERTDGYTGTALYQPTATGLPATVAFLKILGKAPPFEFDADIAPVDHFDGSLLNDITLAERFPSVGHARTAKIKIIPTGNDLEVSFVTEYSSASGTIFKDVVEEKSNYNCSDPMTWGQFKNFVDGQSVDDFIWRGQSFPWGLQTSFHRTGRSDLHRYISYDIVRLREALIPHTQTFLSADDPMRQGALYNLAQHHGFPTPLLDWTESPYVAAFFALRIAPSEQNECARIFAFNKAKWLRHYPESNPVTLLFSDLRIDIMRMMPLENMRSFAQQAMAMITNVNNIERYIDFCEGEKGENFLVAIDIPWSERLKAMQDLRVMGITASSMFPGLDGTCEDLKHRLFDQIS